MALSRLQNFLNNPTGVVLFVDSANFDATDSIENRGTSPGRPFISLQRACIEASRFSFQKGKNNDLNDRTTIIVSPGKHYIDNRPGFSIENVDGSPSFKRRVGKNTWVEDTLLPLGEDSNFDIFNPNNDLYKYNSVHGGLILPRGVSLVAQDLRKTKIIPLYVPDPLDSEVERSSILNVTGSCYFKEFTIFDADSTKFSYKNYSNTKHVPKYSHHKLTAFTYADGVNEVVINSEPTGLTDLDMYYHKITVAYDDLSKRGLIDFPENLEFEPNVNEFRIVGPLQEVPIGISSIRAGNGDGSGDINIITVTTADLQTKLITPHNFTVDTPVIISGITTSPDSYNGTFLVREVIDENTFTYVALSTPQNVLPNPISFDVASISTESDTVSSSSPYIFGCSIKSTYGMCGLWADGSKSLGFKSMVVAQFTGISLQKDNNAYLIYRNGILYDNTTLPIDSTLRPLYQNSRSFYKPDYESFHIKASNDAFIQAVSVFAIGYCNQFITESGGDMSVTNSNSNFGANALSSVGFKKEAFSRDDVGYITHILPPKQILSREIDIPWLSLDINKIKLSNTPTRLYISDFDDITKVPPHQLDEYRIGARKLDKIFIDDTSFSPILMTVPSGTVGDISAKKEYKISRVSNTNAISNSGVITLSTNHSLFTGEKIRLFSNTGQMPDNIKIDTIYYAITSSTDNSLLPNQIKIATSLTESLNNNSLTGLTNNGGVISVISSVTDKLPGEFGHPIQWDEEVGNWYIHSSSDSSNKIHNDIVLDLYPEEVFGTKTPITSIKRIPDERRIDDRIYKARYVIPKEFTSARPPQVGYVIQESSSVDISSVSVNTNIELSNSIQLRNDKIITDAFTSNVVGEKQVATITTELPHNLTSGDVVNIKNIRSSNNLDASGVNNTYNGTYKVLEILSPRRFTYELTGIKINPGTFTSNINQRTTSEQRSNLPTFSRQSYKDNFYIYRVDTIKKHIPGEDGQDGVYHLIILSSSVRFDEELGYNLNEKSFSVDIRNLYPQIDRDNIDSNPKAAVSSLDLSVVGKVITDDKKKSITLDTINKFTANNRIGFNIVNVSASGIGNTTITLTTDIAHNLNSIKKVSFVSNGSGYTPSSTFYSKNLIDSFSLEENSTCNYTTTSGGVIDTNTFSLVDVGAGHTVGEILQVEGGTSSATVVVNEICDNVGDTLELSGFIDSEILNGVYEIINIPSKKTIVIYSPDGLNEYIPNTNNSQPFGYICSKGISIQSMELADSVATITTVEPHGLVIGNKFKITKSNQSYYNNQDFIVTSVVGVSTFTFNVETSSTITSGKILKYGASSTALPIGANEENLFSRGYTLYSGLSINLTSSLTIGDTQISVNNYSGIKRGDFISIDNEILRVSSTPTNNNIKVIRGQFGTNIGNSISGFVVRKIEVIPTEIRRPSSLRASAQTFEYVGYGPGNYSTALPQRQDRILDEDEVLVSQSKKQNSGSIVYTGMNDLGDFYTGSKKISAVTGEEVNIEAPIITYAGDDLDSESIKKQVGNFDELLIRDKIIVEGGRDGKTSSQFYGPVAFNDRLTNISPEGVVISNLYLRNNSTSKNKLIGIGLPESIGESGYISLIQNPSNIGHIGSVYVNDEWRPFGPISIQKNTFDLSVNNIGIGTTSNGNSLNVVGNARIQNLTVYGSVTLPGQINLGEVKFEDLNISGTTRFTAIGRTYSQIHESGISLLNDLEVVGISTFNKDVYVKKGTQIADVTPTLYADKLEVNNIRVGIANSNTIDTKEGDLFFNSQSNKSIFKSDVYLDNKNLIISSNLSTGIVTATIEGGNSLKLGIGHTNRQSLIDLNNDTRVFPYGLRIIRNPGDGNRSSEIIHRGTSPFIINSFDYSEIRLLSNNIPRLSILPTGSLVSYQNSSGFGINDCNLRLNQSGSGDVSLFWDVSANNANRRWYAGIDVSDQFSWKLAAPPQTTPIGNENFTDDTKLKVDVNGDVSIPSGKLIVSGYSCLGEVFGTNMSISGIFKFTETDIGGPTFGIRSPGTRVVYQDNTSGSEIFFDADYATGIGEDYIWHSIPRETAQYQYKWFAGETEIMSLDGTGKLTVSGEIYGTLVDSSIVRNSGPKTISGITTFSDNVFCNKTVVINDSNIDLNRTNFSWRLNNQPSTGSLRILLATNNLVQLEPTYTSALNLDTFGNLELFPLSITNTGPSGGELTVNSRIVGKNGLTLSAGNNQRISSPNIRQYIITGNTSSAVGITTDNEIGVVGSSLKFKREIESASYEYCENVILNSRPVLYKAKPEYTGGADPENVYFGFIAEEVDPKLAVWDGLEPISVSYDRFTVPLVKVVQKQHEVIEDQKQKISKLESELETIKDALKKANLL